MSRMRGAAAFMTAAILAVACADETPTAPNDDLLPAEPITLEINIPWSEFASDLEVFGGYGSPSELGTGVVANDFAGSLDVHTLLRYGGYPVAVSVRDTLGATRPDSALTFIGGRLVAFLDTVASTNDGPVTLALGALQQEWDASTVTWTTAVDTINDQRAWAEAGAGPVADLGTATWDPVEGDSVFFELDSALIAAWSDTTDASRGARLSVLSEGVRLQVNATVLRLNTRPSLNPDSTFFLVAPPRDLSFVYDPTPEPPPDGIRVGGAPAWRTVLDVDVPTVLNGPQSLCDAVGCPVTLESPELNYAALVLTSRLTEAAFQPTDSVGLDVRQVLSRAALPKAPLGGSLIGAFGYRVHPRIFAEDEGTTIEIPITAFARDLVRGEDARGRVPSNTLAFLSTFEPVSIAFASFYGPGTEMEPYLKLIVTVSRAVDLP